MKEKDKSIRKTIRNIRFLSAGVLKTTEHWEQKNASTILA